MASPLVRVIGLALAGGLALTIAGWGVIPRDASGTGPTRVPATTTTAQAPSKAATGSTPADAPSSVAPPLAMPAGVTTAQWAAIGQELQGRPDGPVELRRLAGYFSWADQLRRFREARSAGLPAEALARDVDAGLAERLRQRELSGAEALHIKSALLAAAGVDSAERDLQLRAWAEAHLAPGATDPRQAVFDRQQAALVAAWSALPAGTRDATALTRDLDALRQQVFATAAR